MEPNTLPSESARRLRRTEARVEPLYPTARLLKTQLHEAEQALRQARHSLETIKKEAAQRRKELSAELEALKQQAYEEGARKGHEEFVQLLGNLRGALNQVKQDVLVQVDRLVFSFAKSILDAELRLQPELTVSLVRSVLERARAYSQITVILHPDDLAQIREYSGNLLESLPFAEQLNFKGDADLPRNGCRIETEMGTFDGSLEVQLARMHEHLKTVPATEEGAQEKEDREREPS